VPLTESDREQIRYFTGYLNVGSYQQQQEGYATPNTPGNAASLIFGIPRPVETLFIVEDAMNLVLEIAIPRIRNMCSILAKIENQMVDSLIRLKASEVGNIKLRGSNTMSEGDLLEREFHRWSGRLCDQLGIPRYPFAERNQGFGQGAAQVKNVPVRSS
jgi:hypothetical protein